MAKLLQRPCKRKHLITYKFMYIKIEHGVKLGYMLNLNHLYISQNPASVITLFNLTTSVSIKVTPFLLPEINYPILIVFIRYKICIIKDKREHTCFNAILFAGSGGSCLNMKLLKCDQVLINLLSKI